MPRRLLLVLGLLALAGLAIYTLRGADSQEVVVGGALVEPTATTTVEPGVEGVTTGPGPTTQPLATEQSTVTTRPLGQTTQNGDPTALPTASPAASPTASGGASATAEPSPAASEATPSPTVEPAETGVRPTPTPRATEAPTPTPTPTTAASVASAATPSPTPSPSATPNPAAGDRGGETTSPTATATPLRIPTATPTLPPVAATATPSPTPLPSATPAPAPTPLPTPTPTATPAPTATPEPTPTPEPTAVTPQYFGTSGVGATLRSDSECAAIVRAEPLPETNFGNQVPNQTPGGPAVLIDGAHGFRGDSLAARITGDFTGTTEELIRWAACKWGFDEDITRARVWTESSWSVNTLGDQTNNAQACALIGLSAPCYQSYGLLQVKGTVHEGTYPASFQSSAWGLDYAMAWQRACYEGAFTWLNSQGYTAGDQTGCVGAWFSGEWYDAAAQGYIAEVTANLNNRPWN